MASRVSELRNGKTATGSFADLDDRMLVLDFQAGHSDEAYAEIHRRYVALARHICLRILGNQQDAEEATQETMLRVFQGLSRFNGRYAVQPWVARIATNVSLDITRARARRPQTADRALDALEDHADDHAEGDPGEAVERSFESERVKEILADLPERHREALVLREYEGRSHKEIGDALGVTPTQAKALIHRARGSFRRMWAGRDGDTGVAGLFVFLFLLPHRAVGVLRRLADRAGDASQAAASASPTVTTAAASPAVQVAASEAGQKVVAAAVTILVAGSVTVGATALTHHRAQRASAASPAAAVIAPPSPSSVAGQAATPRPPVKTDKSPHALLGRPSMGPPPSPVDSGTPTTDATSTPTTDASSTPSPDASSTPSAAPPPIPSAPDWSGSFKVDWSSQDECGCKSGVWVGSTTVSGQLTADSALDVDQSFQGAALDAEGDAAWAVSAEYQAHLQADGGTVAFVFTLGTGDDTHQYAMSGSSPTIDGTPGDGNPVMYTFSGSYSEVGANSDTSPIPVQGSVQLQLSVWGDGTSVYGVGFDAWR